MYAWPFFTGWNVFEHVGPPGGLTYFYQAGGASRSSRFATRLNTRTATNAIATMPNTQRRPAVPPMRPANHGRVIPPARAIANRIPNTVPECDLNRAPAIPSAVG